MTDTASLPPPLPSPAAAPLGTAAAAQKFVSLTAKMGMALGGLSVLWCLVQLVLAFGLQQLPLQGALDGEQLQMPRALAYAIQHGVILSLACLLMCLAFTTSCWGMLKRRRWGYTAVIFFLVAIAVANFAALPLVSGFYSDLASMFPAEFYQQEEGRLFQRQMQAGRWTALVFGSFAALAVAALHGWLVIKLRRPEVVSQFR